MEQSSQSSLYNCSSSSTQRNSQIQLSILLILLLLSFIFLSGNCFSDLQYYAHDFAQRFIILLEDEVKAIYIASYVYLTRTVTSYHYSHHDMDSYSQTRCRLIKAKINMLIASLEYISIFISLSGHMKQTFGRGLRAFDNSCQGYAQMQLMSSTESKYHVMPVYIPIYHRLQTP